MASISKSQTANPRASERGAGKLALRHEDRRYMICRRVGKQSHSCNAWLQCYFDGKCTRGRSGCNCRHEAPMAICHLNVDEVSAAAWKHISQQQTLAVGRALAHSPSHDVDSKARYLQEDGVQRIYASKKHKSIAIADAYWKPFLLYEIASKTPRVYKICYAQGSPPGPMIRELQLAFRFTNLRVS